ncbi:hypothetical protein AVEN_194249-1 [Araneus ventricosus]|uniref:Uncharacterized protein n=1 Tax=Araneus ventricosus TaxID=182803 RepID=A0A4Y2GDP3_ARAVE|nr:hypothetical protein AVEN_194249-1 [Araneus ventricosus]
MVCGTTGTPTSDCIVERVTVGSTSSCRTILRSSRLVVFLVAPDSVRSTWVPSRVHCSQQVLTAHSERSTWRATLSVDQPAVFMPMMRPLSNSFNCEKCLLTRLPGILCLLKSSSSRNVIVTFYESSTMRQFIQGPLPDFSATAGCVVMRIGTKLGSFAYRILLHLFAKFHDCTFLLGALFSMYLCVLK